MRVWLIDDWAEVERLALANRTCIAPGEVNYDKARHDFQRGLAVYVGFYRIAPFPNTPSEGYSRLVPDANGDRRIFLDCMRPYDTTHDELNVIYACMESMAELMGRQGFEHLYVNYSAHRADYFNDREKREITPVFAWEDLPSHSHWIDPNPGFFIDLLSRKESVNGHDQI